jgi:hypothetical protein
MLHTPAFVDDNFLTLQSVPGTDRPVTLAARHEVSAFSFSNPVPISLRLDDAYLRLMRGPRSCMPAFFPDLALSASDGLALKLSTVRFQAGAVSNLDVMTAQTIALINQRTADQFDARRLDASVLLLKALAANGKGLGGDERFSRRNGCLSPRFITRSMGVVIVLLRFAPGMLQCVEYSPDGNRQSGPEPASQQHISTHLRPLNR